MNLIEAVAGRPAKVRQVPLSNGKRLRKVKGTLAELAQAAGSLGDDYLLVEVNESQRPGLADRVRSLLPNAVEVRLPIGPPPPPPPNGDPEGRPQDLFRCYLKELGQCNKQVEALFAQLLDDVLVTDNAS